MLTTELIIAISMVSIAVLPIGLGLLGEQKLCRAYYHRAVAMEIVDGELEVLAAGEWQAFPQGTQRYAPRAEAARHLPRGRFELGINGRHVRLAWHPERPDRGGAVVREVTLP